jgi:hypothetical protein
MTENTDDELKADLRDAKAAHKAADEAFQAAQDAYYNAGSPESGELFEARNAAKTAVFDAHKKVDLVQKAVLARFEE